MSNLTSASQNIYHNHMGSAKCLIQFWPSNGVRLVRRRHTKEGLNLLVVRTKSRALGLASPFHGLIVSK
ncbi:hypothetical protein PpBr36_02095 [Pyricularia pennisetigena]|uniref:hypothetical protein n=1 Tax=Pyricularia pennisetigena TaxID=1578925 RepID=UPI001153CEFA|nr:hypothetical protein PpBr36_02095 [Pyricularia pennisetigena]TLS28789.1 hypothetical protein PpBr36_02095 [Pyricularia pennisetigena]